MLKDIIIDTLHDSIGLLPFLFLSYFFIELFEHKAGEVGHRRLKASQKAGPIWGAIFGVIPQCGFSAAASGLYTRKIITVGTLFAVFLSTSDEMLPIFLSEAVAPTRILKILAMKAAMAAITGIFVDLVIRDNRKDEKSDHSHTHHHHSHDHENDTGDWKGLVWAAARHTVEVFLYILLVNFLLNFLIAMIGEEAIAGFLTGAPALSLILAVLVGLIPNCASSVVLTEMYLNGILAAGSMMAGLLVNAGVGVMVLIKLNKNKKENMAVIAGLMAAGLFWGTVIWLTGIVF